MKETKKNNVMFFHPTTSDWRNLFERIFAVLFIKRSKRLKEPWGDDDWNNLLWYLLVGWLARVTLEKAVAGDGQGVILPASALVAATLFALWWTRQSGDTKRKAAALRR